MKSKKFDDPSQFVDDKEGFVWAIARSYYRFLFIHHFDDIQSIASCADFLFPGPRIKRDEFRRIIHRRLYYTAKELGWRKRNSKWEKDSPEGVTP